MYKILFADDEENVLRYLPIAIDWETLGIGEMRTASDGKDALTQAKEFQPDIALVDVEMPGMDGIGVLPQSVENSSEIETGNSVCF